MRRRVFYASGIACKFCGDCAKDHKRKTYGSLLDNNVLDVEVLNVKVFRVRVRLSVLQEAEDELDGLLGPATFTISSP